MLRIRDYFEFIHMVDTNKDSVRDYHALAKFKREHRANITKDTDQLRNSICDDWRYLVDNEHDEYAVQYGIFADEGQSDQELDDFIEEERIPVFNSQYDCTGRWFTTSIRWKRMPIGILVVHHMSRDI